MERILLAQSTQHGLVELQVDELPNGRHALAIRQRTPLSLATFISTATTTLITSSPAHLKLVRCQNGTLGNVKIYKGGVLDTLHYDDTPADLEELIKGPVYSALGWTIVTAAATKLEVIYEILESW